MTDSGIAAVVIGRNEGERLLPSLRSVQEARLSVVYVDSGSSDGSPSLAQSLGVPAIELDPAREFSAARGRNEGMAEVVRRWPDTEFVMFLDGDCTLNGDFASKAVSIFERDPKCAIVTGNLAERAPDASRYNRLCSIEWQSPPGLIVNGRGLGGIMAVRVKAFAGVGGFNEQAIAGEEADFAVRLSKADWSALKIDVPMATHDAQMMHFSQWWRRTVRAGHAMAHRYLGQPATTDLYGRRAVRSAVFWGFLLPATVLLLLLPSRGLSLVLVLGYAWLGQRTYRYYKARGLTGSDAWLATRFILYAKVPEFLGIVRYCVNRLRGSFRVMDWR